VHVHGDVHALNKRLYERGSHDRDNAGTGTQTVNLSGNGETAVSLSRSSINFSSHKVGTASSAQTITLTNLGNKLTIHSISITGTNPGDFAQRTPAAPAWLQVGVVRSV
jgi:hypothetical protein